MNETEPALGPTAINEIPGAELVIGLIGPVGTDLQLLSDTIERSLRSVAYVCHHVVVSKLIANVEKYAGLGEKDFSSEAKRIEELMAAGSDIRRATRFANALALLTVSEIQRIRKEQNKRLLRTDDPDELSTQPLERTAFIVRSLKNPAEIRTLKAVYGRAFFVVSAYSPRAERVRQLAGRIAQSLQVSNRKKLTADAEKLVTVDENEGDHHGQNVRDSYPMADLFIDVTDSISLETDIQRFIEILFGNPFRTPSRDEFSMFHAHAAALRSADLSRQVGAAIANADGKILAVGCNEVPRFGGGLYWEGDPGDMRDFRIGTDAGTTSKIDILSEILGRLQDAELLHRKDKVGSSIRELAQMLLTERQTNIMRGTQVSSIIEFGRAVHAEMAAITDAAQRGVSIRDATLYCTTFPCHLCARHIIAAGIRRVVYIEPYPKSTAEELYRDSMCVDPESKRDDRVVFESFVGVAPSVYSSMFKMDADIRKNPDGSVNKWEPSEKANPKLRRFVCSYIAIEDLIQDNIPRIFTGDYAIIDSPGRESAS